MTPTRSGCADEVRVPRRGRHGGPRRRGTRPRSPIEWAHRRAGARIATRAGWRVVGDYGAPRAEADACRRSVGVADLSFLGKLELQGSPTVAAIVAELAGGARLAPGQATLADGTWWCPISPAGCSR